jgi:hypothetical protein
MTSEQRAKTKLLELDHLALPLLVAAELEVLGALDGDLDAVLALAALESQHQLLGRLSLENKKIRQESFITPL